MYGRMNNLKRNKKGYYFTLDAFLALILILGIVIFVKPQAKEYSHEEFVQDDILTALSTLKISDANDSYVQGLISSGRITNLNQSVLEQIGEFYAKNDAEAEILAQTMLNNLNLNKNIGIYFENNLLASSGTLPYGNAERIGTSRQVISGIQSGEGASTGYSAIALLSSGNKMQYFFFGGYTGDGNISALIIGDVIGGEIEGVFSGPFNLYINNVLASKNTPQADVPYKISLANNITLFNPTTNIVEFKSNSSLYIGGGFIKVIFDTTEVGESAKKRYLPGVSGIINLYDGFYVPSDLESIEVFLHYNSTFDIFMTIGNTTVYQGNSSGNIASITLTNTTLASKGLDFSSLVKKTVPFRIGLLNASYFVNGTLNADVFSVTDLSGSMGDLDKIDDAKEANRILVDSILNNNKNRIGLAGYETTARNSDYHELSANKASLLNIINNEWDASGSTCICCGINKAINGFLKDLEKYDYPGGGQLSYYKFDSSAEDFGSQNNDGTLNGGGYTAGISGNAINLDGTNDYVNVSQNLGQWLGGTASISFWIKIPSGESGSWSAESAPGIFGYDAADDSNDIFWGWINNIGLGRRFAFTVGNGLTIRSSSPNIVSNAWYHVVITRDAGTGLARIYLNGSLNNQGNLDIGEKIINSNSIGRVEDEGGSPEYLNAEIDDLRIYDRVLTPAEVSALFDTSPLCGNSLVETGEVCDGLPEGCTSDGQSGVSLCSSGCAGYDSCDTSGICGDGIKNGFEQCDDGNTDNEDGCTNSCEIEDRLKSMIVMTDGQANVRCPGFSPNLSPPIENNPDCSPTTADDPCDDAIYAACKAYEQYGIKVYGVAFGNDADVNTTKEIGITCGRGGYYFSNVEDLVDIYENISNQIIEATYYEQTVVAEGVSTKLFNDSYIKVDYPIILNPGITITAETSEFNNAESSGAFEIPADSAPYEAKVVSYSGSKWTSKVEKYNNNTSLWEKIYDLGDYNSDFINLGDPYYVNIPVDKINIGNNSVRIYQGLSSSNYTAGSRYNKAIYTIIKNSTGFSKIVATAEGCNWNIEMEGGSTFVVKVPEDYAGSENCYYNSTSISYRTSDAINLAVFSLLKTIDLNNNGRIEVKFDENDLTIVSKPVEGVPFTWETEVQVRVWS